MNQLKEKKLNNKGFSLVELIIVIAIMAVLIGVLAPQYLKFVERSRAATDRDNVDAIVSALQVYAADPDATLQFANNDRITITGTRGAAAGSSALTQDTNGAIAAALTNAGLALPADGLTNRQTFSQVVITISVTGDVITVAPAETAG